jgi:putative ABC transport system permease protein
MAIVPATTSPSASRRCQPNSVNAIYVKASSSGTLSAACQEADALLLNRHGITAAANADLHRHPAVDPVLAATSSTTR